MDFTIEKCKALPDLLDMDRDRGGGDRFSRGGFGGQQNGYSRGGRGGGFGGGFGGDRGSGRGGYGGRDSGRGGARGGGGGGGGRGGSQNSVFVGNLDYNADQGSIEQMFRDSGLNTSSVRLLRDAEGKSRGSAFVDFSAAKDAETACSFDGKNLGSNRRALRINQA